MGVYIEGLDMPTSCGECHDSGLWSGISYLCKGGCFDDYSGCCAIGQAGCPLAEVKSPHGRLGDLDQLEKYMLFVTDDPNCPIYLAAEAEQIIGTMPTIIEAEGKDDV